MSSHKEKDEGRERESRRSGPSSSGGPLGGADLEGSDAAAAGNSRQAGDEGSSSNEQFQKILSEKQELTNLLVRFQADFENYRKRVEKERQRDRHRGVEALIEHILPVLDAFDRALAPQGDSGTSDYRKGFELIRRQLWDALAKQGLVRIESVGKEFDPHFHHAIERVETTSHADGQVIEELQPGYVFHERVLRPAMVRVAVEPQGRSARIPVNED